MESIRLTARKSQPRSLISAATYLFAVSGLGVRPTGMMRDLSATAIKWKAILFVLAGCLASALLLLEMPSWRVAFLLAAAVWSFSRAYYFVFYVVGRYLDPDFRFSGLGAAAVYVWRAAYARKR